ncbi:MAG: hypothetical protein MZV63_24145 [Marinilabiliales bacterium]|nr:hypothetical protein [Marinilabiliales bacterium]
MNTGDTIWIADPGVAPYGITKAAGKLYVTNWAGRQPLPADHGCCRSSHGERPGSTIKRAEAHEEGSVTIIDPGTGKKIKELIVGLHPNEITSDKQRRICISDQFKQRQCHCHKYR